MKLDENSASGSSSGFFNNTAPTSSVFSIGNQNDVNASGQNIIAFCFGKKKGFFATGVYQGNSNSNGKFVFCGFKPALVICKRHDSSSNGNWTMHDNKRPGYNPTNKTLYPNQSYSEDTGLGRGMELFSNGFKFTGNDEGNTSGGHIFMAWAENPFTTSSGVPTTAR